MISNNNFNIMCSEVLEILKYCPKGDVNIIPTHMIDLLNNNKDATYKVEIDPNKSIFKQAIIDETIIMMFIIFRNYWATQEEKDEIDKILNENEISFNDFYSYDKIFNYNNNKQNTSSESPDVPQIDKENQISEKTNTYLIEYKESFIKKIIKLIKEFFYRKNN